MTRPYRVILFDLFGTVAQFVPRHGGPRGPFEWLRAPYAKHRPGADFDAFRLALVEVGSEMAAERAIDHRELPSRERFRRALARGDEPGVSDASEALSLAHMAEIASLTEVPRAHVNLLDELRGRYRLGLVSNFDHAPTALRILERDHVARCFEVTVISDDFGHRKPHPSIFHAALQQLGEAPKDALYVGDTPLDDVVGARNAGMDVAWLNRHGADPCDPAPTHTLRDLVDLRTLLR